MKNIVKFVLIVCSTSFPLVACQIQPGVSGKYLCLNPSEKGLVEELSLDFTSDNKVTVSIAYKNTGTQNLDIPNIPPKSYRYTIEDKKVVILGVSYGMVSEDTPETFLIQGNELIHYNGRFFGGHQCKKKT